MRSLTIIAAALVLALGAGQALAEPTLVASEPSANAVVASPARITLTFNEKLNASASQGMVAMAAMPGMGAMKMATTSSVDADGMTLVITPKGLLPHGKYDFMWAVTSSQGHKSTGHQSFVVR